MSLDSVVMIVGVFEKQFSQKYPRKISKSQKSCQTKELDYADVIDPSDDVTTSGTKFLINFGDNLLSCKKSFF